VDRNSNTDVCSRCSVIDTILPIRTPMGCRNRIDGKSVEAYQKGKIDSLQTGSLRTVFWGRSLLNPKKIDDTCREENEVGEPCGEKRVKIPVVPEYLACFHKAQVNKSDCGCDAKSKCCTGSGSARCKGHPKENHNNACERERQLEVIFNQPACYILSGPFLILDKIS